ncbi:hypothetical protein OSB04_002831 [Centaurea solstitialis]|uniref:Uncharacterized protein n=1 Tax=Centaurea solstitialis TaxID=347529 RepID=A0AA38TTQ3_9ASTR|nr:hypothetical protein OSB04_002831 [Centaurea solstitialis]
MDRRESRPMVKDWIEKDPWFMFRKHGVVVDVYLSRKFIYGDGKRFGMNNPNGAAYRLRLGVGEKPTQVRIRGCSNIFRCLLLLHKFPWLPLHHMEKVMVTLPMVVAVATHIIGEVVIHITGSVNYVVKKAILQIAAKNDS